MDFDIGGERLVRLQVADIELPDLGPAWTFSAFAAVTSTSKCPLSFPEGTNRLGNAAADHSMRALGAARLSVLKLPAHR